MATTISSALSTADQLRAALKRAGYNARRVTVKHDKYSLGSTLYVTIRDASVAKSAIDAIASEFENVRRDQQTGEILGGGNRHVEVSYHDDVIRELAAPVASALAAIANAAPSTVHEVAGSRISILPPGSGRFEWELVAINDRDVGQRLRYCGNGSRATEQTADYFMGAACALVEIRIERDAKLATEAAADQSAPAHDERQQIPLLRAEDLQVASADRSRDLAAPVRKPPVLRIVRDEDLCDAIPTATATVEDWALGL